MTTKEMARYQQLLMQLTKQVYIYCDNPLFYYQYQDVKKIKELSKSSFNKVKNSRKIKLAILAEIRKQKNDGDEFDTDDNFFESVQSLSKKY